MYRVDTKKAIEGHAARQTNSQQGALSEAAEEIINRPVDSTLSGAVIVGVAQVVEALLLAVLGYVIQALYVTSDQDSFYIPVILASVLVANILFNALNAHRIAIYRKIASQLGRVLAGWTIALTMLLVGVFFFKASDLVSRVRGADCGIALRPPG